MNTIILSGRLVAAPELKTTTGGTAVATARLAVNRDYGNRDKADFIPLVFWKGTAEIASKYLSKGDKLIITGELQSKEYEDKDGKRRTLYEVYVHKLELPPKKEQQKSPELTENAKHTLDDDDLPF